jgi:hypothetical protein
MEVKQMNINRKGSAKDDSLKRNDETLGPNGTATKHRDSQESTIVN